MALVTCPCAVGLRRLICMLSFVLSYVCFHMCAPLVLSYVLSYACSHMCALLCLLSYVCTPMFALLCVLSSVLSYVCSYVCSHMCAFICVLSYVYAFICMLSYVCFHRCAFKCVLAYVCSHVCAPMCVLWYACSHVLSYVCSYVLICVSSSSSSSSSSLSSQPLVSYPFAPPHCLGLLPDNFLFLGKQTKQLKPEGVPCKCRILQILRCFGVHCAAIWHSVNKCWEHIGNSCRANIELMINGE